MENIPSVSDVVLPFRLYLGVSFMVFVDWMLVLTGVGGQVVSTVRSYSFRLLSLSITRFPRWLASF